MGNTPKEECDLLSTWLNKEWGVSFKLQTITHRSGKYIGNEYRDLRCFGRKNITEFLELVKPHIIPSMKYKTQMYYKDMQD